MKKRFVSMVSLRNFLSGISHFCGGTIIHPSWILTAAHCMDGLTPIQYEVVAGQHNIHLPDIHEEEFDIGLVKLNSPLKMTDYIKVEVPIVADEFCFMKYGYLMRPEKPGVYTEVAYFLEWIEETMAANSD